MLSFLCRREIDPQKKPDSRTLAQFGIWAFRQQLLELLIRHRNSIGDVDGAHHRCNVQERRSRRPSDSGRRDTGLGNRDPGTSSSPSSSVAFWAPGRGVRARRALAAVRRARVRSAVRCRLRRRAGDPASRASDRSCAASARWPPRAIARRVRMCRSLIAAPPASRELPVRRRRLPAARRAGHPAHLDETRSPLARGCSQ